MQKLLGGFEPHKSQEIADMLRAIAKEAQRAYKRVQREMRDLNVREALVRTWDHVLFCQIQGREVTEVVCARGNNSKNGVPRLRSAVLTALRCAKNVKVTVHKRNPGRLVVQILNGYSVPAVFKETVVGKNVNVKASNEETLTHQDDT